MIFTGSYGYVESKHFWEEIVDEVYYGLFRTVVKEHRLYNHSGVYVYFREFEDSDYSTDTQFISNVFMFF